MSSFLINSWLNLIKQDNIEEVITSINHFTKDFNDKEISHNLLMIDRELYEITKNYQFRIIDFDDFNQRKNYTIKKLVDLIKNIDEKYSIEQKKHTSFDESKSLSEVINLDIKLDRKYADYTLKELKKVFDLFREYSGKRKAVKIIDFNPGSVYVTFEMTHDSFIKLISNIDRREIEKMGISEMKLIDYSQNPIQLFSKNNEKGEFILKQKRIQIKDKVVNNTKDALRELKKIINPNKDIFNDFILIYQKYNLNELNRVHENYETYQRQDSKIVRDLLQMIDRLNYDDIDENFI